MKVKINKHHNYWRYHRAYEYHCSTQEQFDYVFKYLDFDKLEKYLIVHFYDKNTEELFYKINKNLPDGYQWLKDNWGKNIYWLYIIYSDKQELKTIVNRVINVELKRRI